MPLIDLDEPCGRHLKYRDLIACGKTWSEAAQRGEPIDNVPLQHATVAALSALVHEVLDPLVDEFGPVALTYGFASPSLSSKIRRRIAPSLDQHAACELHPSGKLICSRRGAAVDLIVPGCPATEVAKWLAAHTPFDRLYLYGDDRPLHVSHGPEHTRTVVAMSLGPSGRLVPRRLRW
jgi:hypothetical protein